MFKYHIEKNEKREREKAVDNSNNIMPLAGAKEI